MESHNQEFGEFVAYAVHSMVTAKRNLCEAEGGPADGCPILVWVVRKDDETMDVEIIGCEQPTDDLPAPDLLYQALNYAFVECGAPVFGAFVSEAYMRQAESEDEMKDFRRGELERDFHAKADTDVVECMTALCFSSDGTKRHTVIAYKYDDNGMPQFAEPENSGLSGGAMVDVLDNFLGLLNV